MEEIDALAPPDTRLTAAQQAQRVGMAALAVVMERRGSAKKRWMRTPFNASWLSVSEAWTSVISKPSDFLPNHTDPQHCHFKINQFCEDCTQFSLCPTHDAMRLKTTEVDLTERHLAAMIASGHCMVECGGQGDCFYHSIMFLAKVFRPDLFRTWRTHSKLRTDTCEKLSVGVVTFG